MVMGQRYLLGRRGLSRLAVHGRKWPKMVPKAIT